MTAASVRDQICVYFGGAYDDATRTYLTPRVDGLGVVRRSWARSDNPHDYTLGLWGEETGAQLIVQVAGGRERRANTHAKAVAHRINLLVFVRSILEYPEDCEDFTFRMLDAIRDRIHDDRTCGSGGFELGGFQVGEGDEPEFDWDIDPVVTKADVTTQAMRITCTALEYIQA